MDDRQRATRKHVFAVNSSPDFLLIVRECSGRGLRRHHQ